MVNLVCSIDTLNFSIFDAINVQFDMNALWIGWRMFCSLSPSPLHYIYSMECNIYLTKSNLNGFSFVRLISITMVSTSLYFSSLHRIWFVVVFATHTKSHYSMINRCLNEKKKSRNLLHKAAEKKSTVRLNTSEVSLSAFVIDYNNIFWFLWIHETCKNLHETPGIGKWLIQPPKYVRVI